MAGTRHGRKFTEHTAWRSGISHSTEIPEARRRGIMCGDKDREKGKRGK